VLRIGWLFIVAIALAGCASLRPPLRQPGPVAQAITHSWQKSILRLGRDGDWLLIRGYNSTGHLVAVAGNAELSHVGILDAKHAEVIEAVSPEVCATPLASVLEEADRVILIRPAGADRASGRQALARARSQIGAPYDLLGTIGLAWSVGMEVDQDGPGHVLHPISMLDHGAVLFDSDTRAGR
jgi:hypothetical protein